MPGQKEDTNSTKVKGSKNDTHYTVPFRCGVCLFVGVKIKIHLRMLHGVVAVPFRNTLLLKPELICRGSFQNVIVITFEFLVCIKFYF